MPSVSRGVYRWLFHRPAMLEDFADRLNHFWTVGLLLILACIISWKQGFYSAIHCWAPSHFTGFAALYAESVCWDSHFIQYYRDVQRVEEKYNVTLPLDTPRNLVIRAPIVSSEPIEEVESYLVKETLKTTLYQWIPLILCFQALLFKLPNIIMYVFHSYAGLSFGKIASLTNGYEKMNSDEREILSRQIARYVHVWTKSCNCLIPWRLLALTWLCVKVLFCVNIVAQMAVLDNFITTRDPPVDNSTSYADTIVGDLFENNATTWRNSPVFPRDIFCNFRIYQLQNIQSWTLQCHLPINEFNERTFMFIWVWLLCVALVSTISLISWIFRTVIPVFRKRYLYNALSAAVNMDKRQMTSQSMDQFCSYLGEDGVMVLKLTSANSSELLVQDVVCNLWKLYFADGHAAPDHTPEPVSMVTDSTLYPSLQKGETAIEMDSHRLLDKNN